MATHAADVIVIGAGAAGLTAAHRLSAVGRDVVVLEARPRLGGRIHTLRPDTWPIPIEAGAEFVHGSHAAIARAVQAGVLATDPVPDGHWQALGGKLTHTDFDAIWSRIGERLANRRGDDVSFADFLRRDCADLSDEERLEAIAYVSGFEAADPEIVSVQWLDKAERATGIAAGAERVRGGYDNLIRALQIGSDPHLPDIRLNHTVERVRWRKGRVDVSARSADGLEDFVAARAVITTPLGVLAAGAMSILPEPASLRGALDFLPMGAVVKVVLRFHEPFWAPRGASELAFLHSPVEPFLAWWTTRPIESAILTGWSGGPPAAQLSQQPDESIREQALDVLARSFALPRERLATLLVDALVFNWQNDPHSCGGYSYVRVGGSDASRRLAEPIDDTLIFAGEACAGRLAGTVGGAISSGERAAGMILEG